MQYNEQSLKQCMSLSLYFIQTVFTSVINNDKHVLSHILPDPNNHTYNLRPTLAIKGDARNFF